MKEAYRDGTRKINVEAARAARKRKTEERLQKQQEDFAKARSRTLALLGT